MEDNPSTAQSSNGCEESNVEESSLHSDAIGDTAYSQRFVLKILLELSSEAAPTEDFIENDICRLWDMTAEEDVVEFLLKFDAIDVFHTAIERTENNRLVEILIGIVANMCCQVEFINKIRENLRLLNSIISYINSDDSAIIIQVLRLIYSNVYNDGSNLNFWLKCFDENDFNKSIAFILNNSMNENVLKQTLKTLNCICVLVSNESDHDLFIKLFVTNDIVRSVMTAFRELDQHNEEHLIDDDDSECYQIVFLSLNSILTQFHQHSIDAYENETSKLFEFVNVIMKCVVEAFESMNNLAEDLMKYTTDIMSALDFPQTEETFQISTSMLRLWITMCDLEYLDDLPDYEQTDITDTNGAFLPIFIRYFCETFKLWPISKVSLLLNNVQKRYLRILYANSKLMLKEANLANYSMNNTAGYYDNVCPAMLKLIENEQ